MEAGVLDLQAAVLHDGDAGGRRDGGSLVVAEPQLEPQRLHASQRDDSLATAGRSSRRRNTSTRSGVAGNSSSDA